MKASKEIPTRIKNHDLVEKRRRKIIDASVLLFIKQGFHKTTTRQIANATGISIGSLYEYIASKEDILYLVCDTIHHEIERGVSKAIAGGAGGRDLFVGAIREYFLVCNRMSDHIMLIYQETHSLPLKWRKKVLENEVRITGIFMDVLANMISSGDMPSLSERSLDIIAHNISVMGHMWTFRRWFLERHYSIEEYIELQTEFILGISK